MVMNTQPYGQLIILFDQEEKTVLIDTVWAPFAEEFVDNHERDRFE